VRKGDDVKPETLGGIAGVVILAHYLLWRVSMFNIFRRSASILRHLRDTKS
jgi:hypothetical protein